MSGIVGAFYFDKGQRIDAAALERSFEAIAPWGPDGGSMTSSPGIALGQARRASDEPNGDGSPLWDAERRLAIVFDGVLRGRTALRHRLEDDGHRFRGVTQAELVLGAYRHWGVSCVDHLRGTFAFAVYDRRSHTLFLARDRMGARPLYVYRDAERLLFGTGMQAVLIQGVPRVLDPEAVEDYLSFGFVDGGRSLLRDVGPLAPGTAIYADGRRQQVFSYWRPRFNPDRSRNLEQQAQSLLTVIDKTVADGGSESVVALSGGLGSAMVAATAARTWGSARAITAGDATGPESLEAVETARSLGLEPTVAPSAPVTEALWTAVSTDGEPPVDPDALAWLQLGQTMRGFGSTLWTGANTDLVFASGLRYRATLRAHEVRDRVFDGWSRLPILVDAKARWVPPIGKRMARALREDAHTGWYRADFRRGLHGYDATERWARTDDELDPLAQLQRLDLEATAAARLAAAERSERHAGVEWRHPLSDAEVVGFVAGLPDRYRLDVDRDRVVLQRAARRVLPPQIVQRPPRPFGGSPYEWLQGPLRGRIEAVIFSSPGSGLFDREALRRAWYALSLGRAHIATGLWRVAAFEAWAQCVRASER